MMDLMLFLASIATLTGSTATVPEPSAGDVARSPANAAFLATNYPPESLKRGEQGKVAFQLTIEKDGTPVACEVTQSSGFAELDRGTCELLIRIGRLEPSTNAEGQRVRATKIGHINWKLPSRTLAMASAPAAATEKAERIICRRSAATGSIVRKLRRCMTQSEWEEHESQTMEALDQAVGVMKCSDHGC